MKPSSFCTMCTSTCKQELIGFLLSLSIHHRDEKVYVICDTLTKETIENMSIKIIRMPFDQQHQSGVLNVGVGEYFIFAIFNWLSPFMTLLYAALNIKILKKS